MSVPRPGVEFIVSELRRLYGKVGWAVLLAAAGELERIESELEARAPGTNQHLRQPNGKMQRTRRRGADDAFPVLRQGGCALTMSRVFDCLSLIGAIAIIAVATGGDGTVATRWGAAIALAFVWSLAMQILRSAFKRLEKLERIIRPDHFKD
jgi:hypothetical protein